VTVDRLIGDSVDGVAAKRGAGDPAAARDRGRSTVFRAYLPLQRPRQVSVNDYEAVGKSTYNQAGHITVAAGR
jgi:hypothetical protein